jgi:hypothetical protein
MGDKDMGEWIRLARQPDVMERAAKYAVGVGAVLVAINHGAAIMHHQVDRFRIVQICLTVVVPYWVSTSSSVAAMRAARDPETQRTAGRGTT